MQSHSYFAELIQQHIAGFVVESLREFPHIGWGGDSDAFLVNDTLVFRFPRTSEVAQGLVAEICLLPQIAPLVQLRIPQFEYVVYGPASSREDPLPLFVGYQAISGEPLTPETFRTLHGNSDLLETIASQLGAFLTGLHSIRTDRANACGIPAPEASLYEQVSQGYANAQSLIYPVLTPNERVFLDRLYGILLGAPQHFLQGPVLCHGDLSSDHILYDPVGTMGLEGVIDFGDMTIGDPAGDFVWGFEYGEEFLQLVLDHYQGPLADRQAFIRVVGLRYMLMSAGEIAYGLETGNTAYVSEGRDVLRQHMKAPVVSI